jgi:hypothetical protein
MRPRVGLRGAPCTGGRKLCCDRIQAALCGRQILHSDRILNWPCYCRGREFEHAVAGLETDGSSKDVVFDEERGRRVRRKMVNWSVQDERKGSGILFMTFIPVRCKILVSSFTIPVQNSLRTVAGRHFIVFNIP